LYKSKADNFKDWETRIKLFCIVQDSCRLGNNYNCPAGFTSFIDTCVKIPSTLPSKSSYAAAVSSCLAAGQQILSVGSLPMNEGIRSYLNNITANANMWIGQVAGQLALLFCKRILFMCTI